MAAELEWFRNLNRRRHDESTGTPIADFIAFHGIRPPEEFRIVTRRTS